MEEKYDYIFDHGSVCGKKRRFKISRLSNGCSCINGSNNKYANFQKDDFFVLSPKGGRTTAHPLPIKSRCLYEVNVGDYITVYEVGKYNGYAAKFVNAYLVETITDDYAYCVAV